MSTKSETETPLPVGSDALVLRCYGREFDNDRERMLEMALRDLWRNFPEWPSTFGPCHDPDCNGSGRGSGLCADCVTHCIGEITGNPDDAMRLVAAIKQTRHFGKKLRDAVSPENARGMAPGSAVPDSESTNELGR